MTTTVPVQPPPAPVLELLVLLELVELAEEELWLPLDEEAPGCPPVAAELDDEAPAGEALELVLEEAAFEGAPPDPMTPPSSRPSIC